MIVHVEPLSVMSDTPEVALGVFSHLSGILCSALPTFFFLGTILFHSSFFFLPVFFLASFFCAHRKVMEDTNQAPIATAVSTYRMHSRTVCNRPCTEQLNVKYIQQYVSYRQDSRVRQRKSADKNKCFAESQHVYKIILCYFLLFVVLWIKCVS